VQPRYFLVATDDIGSYASVVGLDPTRRNRRARRRIAQRVRREEGRDPRKLAAAGPAGDSPLRVQLDMPKQTPVGDSLPLEVRVSLGTGAGYEPVAQSHLFFQIYSQDGKTPVRWRERTTNTLGTAHINMAAIELPGFYRLHVFATKGSHRGEAKRVFKVRRR
jgi:hypothetical protein